jgi:hypothetical protein
VLGPEAECRLVGAGPLVECVVHSNEAARTGYSVCFHVALGADIAVHRAPSADELGVVLCRQCACDEGTDDPYRLARVLMSMGVFCAKCVEYHLGARLRRAALAEWPGLAVQ